jgi:peptidoglycan L-alanyl-D-glutamate endopeptidase CwlK
MEDVMKITEMISAVQDALAVDVDGKAGPETWTAIYRHIVKPKIGPVPLAADISAVDSRSEKIIASLLSEVQPMARMLVQKAALAGIKIKILSGFRSYAEQDALYAQGRTTPGSIVTKAKAGYSNHNFGTAFDIGVFEGSTYLGDSPKYKAVGVIGLDLGLEWGGNWQTIVDQPHFQLRPSWAEKLSEKQMLAELRARFADGRPVYT